MVNTVQLDTYYFKFPVILFRQSLLGSADEIYCDGLIANIISASQKVMNYIKKMPKFLK